MRCVWLYGKVNPDCPAFLTFSHRCDNDAIADDPQLCLQHWPDWRPLPIHG